MTGLICTMCGERYPADRLMNTCPACGKVLAPEYDLALAATTMTPTSLATRPFDMWRYDEILPVQNPTNIPRLGEGETPLHIVPRVNARIRVAAESIRCFAHTKDHAISNDSST